MAENESVTGLMMALGGRIYALHEENIVRLGERSNLVHALCVHEGRLYDAGRTMHVVDTLTGERVAERSHWILAICVHEGRLYDAGSTNRIFDTFAGTEVGKREDAVQALCSNGGRLYDAGEYCLVYAPPSG